MQRLTQPFVSDVRRPRHGENLRLRPGSKRLPITSLWDEMASAAPVEVDEPLYPQSTSASGWDGRPFADDDDENVPEVVIRHVSAMTESAALFGYSGPAGAAQAAGDGPRVRVDELCGESRTAGEWPRVATPALPRAGMRAALVGLGLLVVAVTWRLTAADHAVARAQVPASPPTVLAAAPMLEPERGPEPAAAAPAADLAAVAPETVSPAAAPGPAAPVVAAVTPESSPAIASESDDGFDYRSARRYLDEQASFLRQTCMRKAKTPLSRLRIHVKARPNGRAAIAVPGVGPEVADCVRKALSFPFDRSPHGGAFLYSLGTKSSRLEQRPL